jgi:hypothetical protein
VIDFARLAFAGEIDTDLRFWRCLLDTVNQHSVPPRAVHSAMTRLYSARLAAVLNFQVDVTAADGDDGLPAGPVMAVGRDAKRSVRHDARLLFRGPNPVVYRHLGSFQAAPSNVDR